MPKNRAYNKYSSAEKVTVGFRAAAAVLFSPASIILPGAAACICLAVKLCPGRDWPIGLMSLAAAAMLASDLLNESDLRIKVTASDRFPSWVKSARANLNKLIPSFIVVPAGIALAIS